MKKATLTLETAKAMYNEGGTAKQFALDNYTEEELTKKELPKSWEGLKGVRGAYISDVSRVEMYEAPNAFMMNKNTWPTQKEAEAALALSQLCQLRDAYNGEHLEDWCDWNNELQNKYIIYTRRNKLCFGVSPTFSEVMTFKTPELRDEFYENFKDLLEIAKPLL